MFWWEMNMVINASGGNSETTEWDSLANVTKRMKAKHAKNVCMMAANSTYVQILKHFG